MKRKHPSIPIWAVLVWLLVWQLASMALNKEFLLASPLRVLERLGQLVITAFFWFSIGFSLLRIAGGFFLAVAAGILLAALSARFRRVQELLSPPILAMKTIPVASFIILALIWFSSRNLAVLISFLMVLPVIYTNVLTGIQSADRQLLEMGEVFGLSAMRTVRYLYVPEVLPFFRSGCHIALGLCWKSGIAAEVIGVPEGSIGEHLQQAKIYLDTPDLLAWTLVIVIVCIVFEKLVHLLLKLVAAKLERV